MEVALGLYGLISAQGETVQSIPNIWFPLYISERCGCAADVSCISNPLACGVNWTMRLVTVCFYREMVLPGVRFRRLNHTSSKKNLSQFTVMKTKSMIACNYLYFNTYKGDFFSCILIDLPCNFHQLFLLCT